MNFLDELSAAYRLCDGVVVFVDASEGVMLVTEQAIKHALQEKLSITICINKVGRALGGGALVGRALVGGALWAGHLGVGQSLSGYFGQGTCGWGDGWYVLLYI